MKPDPVKLSVPEVHYTQTQELGKSAAELGDLQARDVLTSQGDAIAARVGEDDPQGVLSLSGSWAQAQFLDISESGKCFVNLSD